MQKCKSACGLCKSAEVRSEKGVGVGVVLFKGNRRPDDWRGFIFLVTGLGRQASGAGVQVRVQVQERPVPVPGAEGLNLGPDCRDLRPENEQALALFISATDSEIALLPRYLDAWLDLRLHADFDLGILR